MKSKLSLNGIGKTFLTREGEIEAIEEINLDVFDGEILAIVGTSGCGKSTLLNIIADLEKATKGSCIFDSDNPKISYMLQSDALLPWRNVLDNACLGLELEGNLDKDSKQQAEEMLRDYGLGDFLLEYPKNLSGGMRQRVALIRSLAINPDIILLDEPFSALDYYNRITISQDVHDILKESKATAIIITHDINEALSIGDRVALLTSRPSKVKNIYDIEFKDIPSILEKRSLPEFGEMYKKIWSELDENV